MNYIRIFAFIAVFFSCSLMASLPNFAIAQDGVHFYKGTWDELVVEAKKTGKPYFIDFWATWCGPCKLLNNTTFKDKTVGELANTHFIPYKLDVDQGDGRMLAGQYGVTSMPTIIFFSSDGKILGREIGYQNAEKFAFTLKKYISDKKIKKNSSGKTTGSAATFRQYHELKTLELNKLQTEIRGTDTAFKSLCIKANEFGKRKEDLMFEDLKTDAGTQLPKDQIWILDAEYYLGAGDFEKVKGIIHPLFEAQKLTETQIYFWVGQFLHMPDDADIPHEPMKWINHLIRIRPDNMRYLDTKLALLLKDQKKNDASELVKQFEKQNKNVSLDDSDLLKIIMDVVKAQGNS